MLEPFAAKSLYVWLRFSRWDNVLMLTRPDPKMGILTALWHFGRAVAFAKKGQPAEAAAEREAFREVGRSMPAAAPWNYNRAGDMITVMKLVIDGRIAAAAGNDAAAIEAFTRAVAAQDALNYDEPADWYYPVRETLGATLVKARQFEAAEQVFREDLRRNPGNGRSLFGLWQTLTLEGNAGAAAQAEADFRKAWAHADVALTLADF
jgi:tetratricopeptide (TPR) repeat protein